MARRQLNTGQYSQTYSTTSRTHAAVTATAVATTGSITGAGAYGYAQAQADDVIAQLNALRTDVIALKQVVNAVIDDLQVNGILGGT